MFKKSLVFLLVLEVLLGKCYLFSFNFLFELIDLMVHNFVASLGLSDLIFSLRKVLAFIVTVGSYWLIKLLLFFQSIFSLYVLLLILWDEVAFKFDFLKWLLVLGIGQCCLLSIHILLFLNFHNGAVEPCNSLITLPNLFFIAFNLFLFLCQLLVVALKLSLESAEVSQDDRPLSFELFYFPPLLGIHFLAIKNFSL